MGMLYYRTQKKLKSKSSPISMKKIKMGRAITNKEKHTRLANENPDFRKFYKKNFMYFELGYVVTKIRQEQGITQKKLAKIIGTTQSVVARIEAGKQNFTVRTLQKIANAMEHKVKIEIT